MRTSRVRLVALMLPLLGAVACRASDSGHVDAASLRQSATGPVLRVTVLGRADDPRVPAAREAIAHWNDELARLGRRVRLALDTVRGDAVGDDLLRAASGEAMRGGGPATDRLQSALAAVDADVVVALSHADLISFGLPWRAGAPGIVGVRRSDIPPLSLPNTVRNVVAHELGHVLGLTHNVDSATLMCGRPAPCRPAAFASDRARFFPLSASDERRLRERWP